MIKASALSYAIVFILLVGLICSSLIFINTTQKRVEFHYTTDEHLLLDSYSALQFGIQALAPGDSTVMVHPFGDSSEVKCRNWGSLTVYSTRTFKNKKEKRRSAVVGLTGRNPVALFLAGNSGGLKIAGETILEGDIVVPNKQIETAYLSGKLFTRNKYYSGDLLEQNPQLPELRENVINYDYHTITQGLKAENYLPKDSSYSFHKKTTYYQSIGAITIENALSGNVIIHSFDSILVTAKAKLKDVILVAPKIRFETTFKGTVQAIATHAITLEKNVQLQFPSYLMLAEKSSLLRNASAAITVGEESTVLGGILITTEDFDFRLPPKLKTENNCTVAGIVYNVGVSELAGNFIGSVYTKSLLLRYGGGEYSNHLLDVLISSKRIPPGFCYPNWLKDNEKLTNKLIRWI